MLLLFPHVKKSTQQKNQKINTGCSDPIMRISQSVGCSPESTEADFKMNKIACD